MFPYQNQYRHRKVADMEDLEAVAASRFLDDKIEYPANELGIGVVGDPPHRRKCSNSAH